MAKPYNYDLTVIYNFFYNCKKHVISVLARRRLLTRRCNLEANMFESFHFCLPLFEGNFTITREWVRRPKFSLWYEYSV